MDESLYTFMADNASEAIFVFERDGSIIYANGTAYGETEYPSFDGVNICDIYPIEFCRRGNTVIRTNTSENGETYAYKSNKTCYSASLNVLTLEDGTSVLFATNNTAKVEAENRHMKAMREVSDATKLKDQFTSNITHELRTPINGIKGMAEGLMETSLTPGQEESVDIILHCCENMTKIINDILDFSKLAAGKIEIVPREFDLGKMLRDNLNMHSIKINEKGLKLMVNVSGRIPSTVIADDLRIEQVINNLMSNAIKFTSEGHIGFEVSATPVGNDETELYFMIIDSGIGIAPEDRDKLFKSFSQVDGSITRRFGGTGLGLSITKQLVEMMGGTIGVESEKDKGSTFTFSVRVKNGLAGGVSGAFSEGSFEFKGNLPTASRAEGEAGSLQSGISAEQGSVFYDINASDDSVVSTEAFSLLDDIPDLASNYDFTEVTDDPETTKLLDAMERLLICAELGSWEKAEGFADLIKRTLSTEEKEIKQKAFSLLLNVRKENYDMVIVLATELEKYIRERK